MVNNTLIYTLQLPPGLRREEFFSFLLPQSVKGQIQSTEENKQKKKKAQKRLLKDFSSLQNSTLVGLSGAPREGDIFTWDCLVCGLPDTMFEMGTFELTLTFTTNYPFQAPSVRFITDIFHPNISPAGILPLDHWTPAMDVTELLSYTQRLLSEPDLSSVVNQEAARLYREDRREFVRRVDRVIERSLDIEQETPSTLGKKSSNFQWKLFVIFGFFLFSFF